MADEERLTDYITRDMYRQIKTMNREKLCDFLFNLYKEIYSDYEEKVKDEYKQNIDYEKVRNEVLKIHGIGDVKANQIVEIVKQCTDNKEGDS